MQLAIPKVPLFGACSPCSSAQRSAAGPSWLPTPVCRWDYTRSCPLASALASGGTGGSRGNLSARPPAACRLLPLTVRGLGRRGPGHSKATGGAPGSLDPRLGVRVPLLGTSLGMLVPFYRCPRADRFCGAINECLAGEVPTLNPQ